MAQRDSHTVSRFRGINAIDSEMNTKPMEALSSLNAICLPSGELWNMRDTSVVLDFTVAPLSALSTARILSLGLLDDQEGGHVPRLVIQQGDTLLYSDSPGYANTAACTGKVLVGLASRLSYAQSASVLYFSNRLSTGKLLPGDPSVYNSGIAQPLAPPLLISATTTMLGVTAIQRTAGVVTVTFGTPASGFVGDPVYVDSDASATWPPSFAGLYKAASVPGATVTYAQPGLPDAGPFVRAVFAPGLTAATGYLYRFSGGFTKTKHWSTASQLSALSGPLTQQSPALLLPIQPDVQVDQFSVFRNLDGGGDWYLEGVTPIILAPSAFPGYGVYIDTTTDDTLESSAQTPPYDNGVAPAARYLATTLDRILACGIDGDLSSVAYSGYDSINYGRPQESWPFFNRIKIGEGQEIPNGIGITRYGAVLFTQSSNLYIVRGTLNDITVSAPTPPSFIVQNLPFRIGLYSHFTLQSTSSGLLFLDDALRMMLFDGYYEPQQVAPSLAGVLGRITPGYQDLCASVFLKLDDRQWYILSVPVDGSTQNNLTIILDRTPDQDRNTGQWVTTFSLDDVVLVLNRDGTRTLLSAESQRSDGSYAAAAGWVTSFPLVYSPADAPSTLLPNASWRSGYFGIKDEDGLDEFSFIKLFRYVQLTTGLSPVGCNVYLVDRENYDFDNPLVIPVDISDGIRGGVNIKARACSVELIFPPGSSAPISSLTLAWNMARKR